MGLHHVNFHTVQNKPVFESDEYDGMMRATIKIVLRDRRILCLAWELMPTHLHAIVQDFDDFPRAMILQHLKGDTSRQFFRTYPGLREDLMGGHLWSKGYWATRITSHKQFRTTLDYVRTNRARADLPPPVPLQQYNAQ
jgi:REP element-mobilizing transposase RayT